MKKILLVLLLSIVVLFGCSTDTTQTNGDVNNDTLDKQTITGVTVSYTDEIFEEGTDQTTHLTNITLTNSTSDDITIAITGFGASSIDSSSSSNTIFGYDENLTEFTAGDYVIPANNSINFEVYYTIPADLVIDEVLLYDSNYTQYIFD